METTKCENSNAFTEENIDAFIDNLLCVILREMKAVSDPGVDLHRTLKSPDVTRQLSILFRENPFLQEILYGDDDGLDTADDDELEENIIYQEMIGDEFQLSAFGNGSYEIPLKEKSYSAPKVTRTNSIRKLISRIFMRRRDKSESEIKSGEGRTETKVQQKESTAKRFKNSRQKRSPVFDDVNAIKGRQENEQKAQDSMVEKDRAKDRDGVPEGNIFGKECNHGNNKRKSHKEKRYAEFSLEERSSSSGKLSAIRSRVHSMFAKQ